MDTNKVTKIDNNTLEPEEKTTKFEKWVVAAMFTNLLIGPYNLIGNEVDRLLANTYGHEPVGNLIDRVTTKTDAIIDKHTILSERKNIHISLPKVISQSGSELAKDFSFITFISTLDSSQASKEGPLINDLVGYGFGMFPKNLIEKYLDLVMLGTIKDNSIDADTKTVGYFNSTVKLIKLEPEIYVHMLRVSATDIRHEIIHAIFSHGSNTYWENRWKKEVGDYPNVPHNFIGDMIEGAPYGFKNTYEDMATIGAEMLRLGGLEKLNKKANPIILKKISVMKSFLYEISQGSMNEEYWENIKTGNIRHGIQAQEFFNKHQ